MRPNHERVRQVLFDNGPLPSVEVARFFDPRWRREVSAIISTMHRGVAKPQVHISSWTRVVDGTRAYLRPVYKLGAGQDARRPKPLTNREVVARYKARLALPAQTAARVPNSVWQLGAML